MKGCVEVRLDVGAEPELELSHMSQTLLNCSRYSSDRAVKCFIAHISYIAVIKGFREGISTNSQCLGIRCLAAVKICMLNFLEFLGMLLKGRPKK